MTDQDYTLLRTLVSLAWADGSLAEGELEWIGKVMDQLQLPEVQRAALLSGPSPLPDEAELAAALPEPGDRETFLRFLFSVSLEDGTTTLDELTLLRDLGARLGISEEALEAMRQEVFAS